MIGQKKDKDSENHPPYKVFKVPKGTDSLSESFAFPFSFSLYLLPPWPNSSLTRQARTEDLGPSHLPL